MAFAYFDQPYLVLDGPHRAVEGINAFRANLDLRYAFSKLKLETLFKQQTYVLAGGSVLNSIQCATSDAYANSDLDIFVLGESDEAQERNCRALLQHLGSLAPVCSGKVWFANLFNVICVWYENVSCTIQIIRLPDCKTVTDVICNFDQTCCQWGYTGDRVWCTLEAISSLATSTNRANKDLFNRLAHYNPDKTGLKFARRMRKMEARGFHTTLDNEQPGSNTFSLLGQAFRDTRLFPDVPGNIVPRPIFQPGHTTINKELLHEACGMTHLTMKWEHARMTCFLGNNTRINKYNHKYTLDGSMARNENIPFRKAYKPSSDAKNKHPDMTPIDFTNSEEANEMIKDVLNDNSDQEETYFTSLMKMLHIW